MGVLIDSSVIIAAERGKLAWDDLLSAGRGQPTAISVITASELLHGVYRAGDAGRVARDAFVEKIISTISVIPIDLSIARVHARLASALSAAGKLVGPHDLLIAAMAVSIGYEVLTRDMRSFPRIPDVRIVQV